MTGGRTGPPPVVVEVCRCGCTPHEDGSATHPDWPLATAWAWLTRGADAADAADGPADDGALEVVWDGVEDEEPVSYPWWDARAQASRRRAVLPLVLLGELQAGVLLRALYEVARGSAGPMA